MKTILYHTGDTLDAYAQVTIGVSTLVGFVAENTSDNTYWVQVYDSNAEPSINAVPLFSIKTPAGSQATFDGQSIGNITLQNGIMIALSSSGHEYVSAGSFMWLTVWYI